MEEKYFLTGGTTHYEDPPKRCQVKPNWWIPIRPQPTIGVFPSQHFLQPDEVFTVSALFQDRHEDVYLRLGCEPGWIGPNVSNAIADAAPHVDKQQEHGDVAAARAAAKHGVSVQSETWHVIAGHEAGIFGGPNYDKCVGSLET